jgi:hypothetical protein
MNELEAIYAADLPEIEKLAQAFGWITSQFLQRGELEVELARATDDREALVKEQIKLSLMKSVRGIFSDCYRRTTGRKAWDERNDA